MENLITLGLIFTLFSWIHGLPMSPTMTIATTTSAQPPIETTTPKVHIDPPFVEGQLCPNKLDIVLAIDSSGSVQKEWNEIIDNAQILLSNFLINPNYTRVGIIDFSAVSNVYTPLDSIMTDEGAFQAFEKMRGQPQNGETWVELGIDRSNDLFKAATPFRENARKVVVIYTDGKLTSEDTDSVKALVKEQRALHIETFVVKVSTKISNEGITALGCKESNIFRMLADPSSGEQSLNHAVCGDLEEVPGGPVSTTPLPEVVKTTTTTATATAATTASTTTSVPVGQQTTSTTQTSQNQTETGKTNEICYLPADSGPCESYILRYRYNSKNGNCEFFSYGGCGGNANNFGSIKDCQDACHGASDAITTTMKPAETTTKPPVEIQTTTMNPINTTSTSDIKPLQTTKKPVETSTVTSATKPDITSSTKCEQERDHAMSLLASKVPTVYPVFVPECSPDGRYKQIQHHDGTEYYWCVNEETGDVINGTRTTNELPKCPGDEETSNKTLTTCEEERSHTKELSVQVPDIFIPQCSLFDGLYMEVQSHPLIGKWCVNRFTGDEINGTTIPAGEGNPLCPEKSLCETIRGEAMKSNYQSAGSPASHFVPQCEPNGLYAKIQVHGSTGVSWCVNEATGKEINGTKTSPEDGMPVCPGEVNPICLLPKVVGQCRAAVPRYFFNADSAQCENFTYGGCNGNSNSFDTFTECHSVCGMLTRCIIDREEAQLMQPNANHSIFIPDCEEDGLFRKLQRSYNGSTWCVHQKIGAIIEGTMVTDKDAVCTDVSVEIKHDPKCHIETGKLLTSTKANEREGIFVPRCTDDGFYDEIQAHGKIAETWCVHKYTGIEIVGTRKKIIAGKLVCPEHENKDCLLPKDPGPCFALFSKYFYDWQQKRCARFNYGGCQGNDNQFSNLKECEDACKVEYIPPLPQLKTTQGPNIESTTTPKVPQVGTTPKQIVETTRAPPGPEPEPEPEVEPTEEVDIYKPQNPCTVELDYAKQRTIANHIVGGYLPECEQNGDYKQIQHHDSSGFKWCVDPKTGHSIDGTKVGPGQGEPDCTKGPTTSGNETTGGNHSEPIHATPTPTPEPGPEPTPKPIETDIYHPRNPCTVELDFAKQANAVNVIGGFTPACEDNGDYKQIQRHGSTGYSWCVDPKTGHLIDSTEVGPGQGEPDCTKGADKSGNQTTAGNHANTNQATTTAAPHPEPEPSTEPLVTDKYYPENLCPMELEFALQSNEVNKINGFTPECEANGEYKQIQGDSSTGYRWCVDQKTGHLINGTEVGPGQGEPNCTKAKTNNSSDSNNQTSNHGNKPNGISNNSSAETPQPEPEPEPEPKPIASDKYHPNHPCLVELDFAKQAHIENRMVGVFVPECEANGDYKQIQKQGSTGYRWCVDQKTGHLINGTEVGPGQEEPDCTKGPKPIAAPLTVAISPETSTTNATSGKVSTNAIVDKDLGGPHLEAERDELKALAKDCPYVIGINLTKIGCFNDDQQIPRPLPVLILNGKNIELKDEKNKDDWKEFIRGFVCKCAIETRRRSWYTFGIQDYGECFSGPDEGRYDEDRESKADMCINEEEKPCAEKDNQACAGISSKDKVSKKDIFANYVFTIKTDTHKEIKRIEYDKKKRSIKKRKQKHSKHARHH